MGVGLSQPLGYLFSGLFFILIKREGRLIGINFCCFGRIYVFCSHSIFTIVFKAL